MKLFRWWGVKRPAAPAKPTRVRKKAAASEDAPKKTTRKKATRKRTTRAKTVIQSEAVDESDSHEATFDEESYESSDQSTDESGEEPLDRDAEIQRAMDEEDWDRLEELTRPDDSNTSSSGKGRPARINQPSTSSRKQAQEELEVSAETNDSTDSGEESADQDYLRVDEGHKSLKGLSKKQRRDMKKRQKHSGYDDGDDE